MTGQALNLTPIPSTRELEGVSIPVLGFTDGEKKVSYQLPGGWAYTGGSNLLTLYPSDRSDVLAEFQVTALEPADPNAPPDGEAWCRRFLPKDALKVTLESETVSPFTLNALPSHEYIYSYVSQNRRFSASVSVIDLSPRERLSVVITAKAADFKNAREEVFRSLFTMAWND